MAQSKVENIQRPIQPEHDGEVTKTVAFGTGTIVLSAHRRGHLWVAEQRFGKTETGRGKGQQSIFLETAVVGESPSSNLLASMAEMVDDEALKQLQGKFHIALPDGHFVPSETTPGVHFRHPIVVFSGDPEQQFTPAAAAEVGIPKLVPVEAVLQEHNPQHVRPLAREVVALAVENSDIEEAYHRYDAGRSIPLFQKGFSIEQFDKKRSLQPDHIMRRRIIQNK